MSFEVIEKIETTNASGVTVAFELREKDGTVPDPIPKFQVLGYKLRFRFSDNNGLGYLNTDLTLDILDDSSDTYYNLFNNSIRDDYGISVKRDGKVLFWGFPDFQSLKKTKFESRKRAIQVKFYTPIQFSKDIGLYRDGVLASIAANEGTEINSNFIRFQTFFEYIFKDYLTDTIEVVSKIDALNGQGAGLDGLTDFCLFNTIYFRKNTIENIEEDISYVGFMKLICEIFYLRFGYSYTTEMPSLYSHHSGYRNGQQRVSEVLSTKINVDSGKAFVNNVTNTDEDLPELVQDNMLRSVISEDVNPLLSVTYNREGGDYDPTNPDFAGSAKHYTDDNPNVSDPRFYSDFEGSLIPFDPYAVSLALPETVIRIRKNASGNVFDTILNRVNDNELSATIYQDLTKNIAQSLMRLRAVPRENDKFTYRGMLDPMRNYTADFDSLIHVIVEGEWDLIRDTTIVKRSISFDKNE